MQHLAGAASTNFTLTRRLNLSTTTEQDVAAAVVVNNLLDDLAPILLALFNTALAAIHGFHWHRVVRSYFLVGIPVLIASHVRNAVVGEHCWVLTAWHLLLSKEHLVLRPTKHKIIRGEEKMIVLHVVV